MRTETMLIMGMPVTIIVNKTVPTNDIKKVFHFFQEIDRKYSPYKHTSEVARINSGELTIGNYSAELQSIMRLAEKTKKESHGFFDTWHNGKFDPSGIVKGWAISKAAKMLRQLSTDFYVEAGGDIQVSGNGSTGNGWRIGIRNPFNRQENIAIVTLHNQAIATSGTAIRGNHIYNPRGSLSSEVVSLSVIANDIVDADRMATAAFSMGVTGIQFIENLPNYEALTINKNKIRTETPGWKKYEVDNALD